MKCPFCTRSCRSYAWSRFYPAKLLWRGLYSWLNTNMFWLHESYSSRHSSRPPQSLACRERDSVGQQRNSSSYFSSILPPTSYKVNCHNVRRRWTGIAEQQASIPSDLFRNHTGTRSEYRSLQCVSMLHCYHCTAVQCACILKGPEQLLFACSYGTLSSLLGVSNLEVVFQRFLWQQRFHSLIEESRVEVDLLKHAEQVAQAGAERVEAAKDVFLAEAEFADLLTNPERQERK